MHAWVLVFALPVLATGEWGEDRWEQIDELFGRVIEASGYASPIRLVAVKDAPAIAQTIGKGKELLFNMSALAAKVPPNTHDFDIIFCANSIFSMARDPHEAAFLFAHELIHLQQGHVRELVELRKRAAKDPKKVDLDAYQRMVEDEADKFGLGLACKAGFDPRGSVRALERGGAWIASFGEPGKGHSTPKERIKRLRAMLAGMDAEACLKNSKE